MKVGILGATGAVGRQMLQCLEERNLNIDVVKLFASERSKGKKFHFKDQEIEVEVADETSFDDLDYVLGAVSNEQSKAYWQIMKDKNVVYIDNSSAFRLEEDVPLVVPEINGEDALKHKGLIANPNCSTIITYMALAGIHRLSPIQNVIATTFQAVSGAGAPGLQELHEQVKDIEAGNDVKVNVFPTQIAFNCIAEIGAYGENGYTSEEMKMQNEGRKILHQENLNVTCTCVRVPVYRSHSISVAFELEKEFTLDELREAIKNHKGVVLMEEHVPTPLETSNQDKVYVGRIRKDLTRKNAYTLWCCGDQIRKGAASNAVDILEYLENK